MAKEIRLVMGCKGGVGKTTTAKAMVDLLLESGEEVLVIDADRANSALYKTYKNAQQPGRTNLVVKALDLDEVEGWGALVNLCEELPNHVAVIDTPAGSHDGFKRYAETLHGSLGELEREWVSYFVLNGQRDSVELLRDYLELIPSGHVVHAVCNSFFGEERAFARYDKSSTRAELERRGGRSVLFPALAGYLVAEIDWERYSYTEALRRLPVGHRNVLKTWRLQARQAFEQLRLAA